MRSSTPWSGAEVAGVKLGGGTHLARGQVRQMEHDCDGRREFGWGSGVGEGGVHPVSGGDVGKGGSIPE
jgi:hypothetical protein